MEKVSAQSVREILEGREDGRVINVLPEEQFREKHIPGSFNVPLEHDSFQQRVGHLTENKASRVVVYCADADCQASVEAARELREAGFQNVVELEGGVEEWERAGLPLEGTAVDAEKGQAP